MRQINLLIYFKQRSVGPKEIKIDVSEEQKKPFRCLSGFESTSRNKVSDGTEPKAETLTDWLNGQRHLVTAD